MLLATPLSISDMMMEPSTPPLVDCATVDKYKKNYSSSTKTCLFFIPKMRNSVLYLGTCHKRGFISSNTARREKGIFNGTLDYVRICMCVYRQNNLEAESAFFCEGKVLQFYWNSCTHVFKATIIWRRSKMQMLPLFIMQNKKMIHWGITHAI